MTKRIPSAPPIYTKTECEPVEGFMHGTPLPETFPVTYAIPVTCAILQLKQLQ